MCVVQFPRGNRSLRTIYGAHCPRRSTEWVLVMRNMTQWQICQELVRFRNPHVKTLQQVFGTGPTLGSSADAFGFDISSMPWFGSVYRPAWMNCFGKGLSPSSSPPGNTIIKQITLHDVPRPTVRLTFSVRFSPILLSLLASLSIDMLSTLFTMRETLSTETCLVTLVVFAFSPAFPLFSDFALMLYIPYLCFGGVSFPWRLHISASFLLQNRFNLLFNITENLLVLTFLATSVDDL